METHGETSFLEVGTEVDAILDSDLLRAADVLLHNVSGSRPPLIMIRTWSQRGEYIRDLARNLGPEQPVVSIAPPDFVELDDYPQCLEDWIDFVIQRISDSSVSGPFCLGGWSFGGVLAYEIACRMQAKGEDVRMVLLLDSRVPRSRSRELARYKKMRDKKMRADAAGFGGKVPLILWWRRARRHFQHFWGMEDREQAWLYARARIFGQPSKPKKTSVEKRKREAEPERVVRLPGRPYAVGGMHSQKNKMLVTSRGKEMTYLQRTVQLCYVKYQHRSTSLSVAVFYTEQSREAVNNDPSLGWEPYLEGPRQYIRVSGTHHSMFDLPKDEKLAAQIGEVIDTAYAS